MNKEELAKLYEQANKWSPLNFVITMEELDRFATLVADAERKRCHEFLMSLHMQAGGKHNYYHVAANQLLE